MSIGDLLIILYDIINHYSTTSFNNFLNFYSMKSLFMGKKLNCPYCEKKKLVAPPNINMVSFVLK